MWLAKPFLLIPIATMWMDCEIAGLLEGEILGDLDVSQPQNRLLPAVYSDQTCGTTFIHSFIHSLH